MFVLLQTGTMMVIVITATVKNQMRVTVVEVGGTIQAGTIIQAGIAIDYGTAAFRQRQGSRCPFWNWGRL